MQAKGFWRWQLIPISLEFILGIIIPLGGVAIFVVLAAWGVTTFNYFWYLLGIPVGAFLIGHGIYWLIKLYRR